VTEPRLGVTFTVSIQTPTAPSVSALLVGGCLPFQRTMIDPSLCTNLYQWTEPAFVLSRVDAREFSMGIPNDARFLGALVCVQAVFTDTTLCWRATDGMRFLICQ
jgi:hypothetical protein